MWNIFGGFTDHIKDHTLDILSPIIFLILHSYYFFSDIIGVC